MMLNSCILRSLTEILFIFQQAALAVTITVPSHLCLRKFLNNSNGQFLPLIQGYSRIILAFVSFYYMADSPIIFTICYLLSGLLDAFDGHFARLLGQCKKMRTRNFYL